MARNDANPPMPEFSTSYVLQEVDPKWLTQAVKPKQFLHIDQAECILCEGCVDISPYACSGIGPMLTMPCFGLGMNATVTAQSYDGSSRILG